MPRGPSTLEGSENDLLLPPIGGQGDKASEPQSEAGFRTRSLEGPGGRRLGWSTCCLLSTSHPSSQVILKQPCEVGIVNPILPHFLDEKTDILESGHRFLGPQSCSLGTTRTGMPSAPFHGLSKKQEEKEENGGRGRRSSSTSAEPGTSSTRTTSSRPLSGLLQRPLNWCLCFLSVPWPGSSQHSS